MIKKVLIVGGAGYIGGAVVNFLIKEKIPFAVYDNLTYRDNYLFPLEFIKGDIRDVEKLKKTLSNYSHVVWLAAIVGDGASIIDTYLTKQINQDCVKWLSRNFDGRIIFSSTCSVYGFSENPVSENSKMNPLSYYSKTKLEAEKFLIKKNALILRFGTAYGTCNPYSRIRMDLAINYMTYNAIKKEELRVMGGKQWRPFLHVMDAGRIIVDNLEKNIGIYNIATENIMIKDLALMISKEIKCRVKMMGKETQDNRSYNVDFSNALKDKLFTSKSIKKIKDGITDIKNLVLSKRVKDFDNELYYNENFLLNNIEKYRRY